MSTSVGSIHYDLSIDHSKFSAATSAINSQIKGMQGPLSELNDGINRIGLAFVAATAVAGAAMYYFIKQASELESVKASFVSLTGSVEEAENVLGRLYKFSFETAFSTQEINSAARQLLAVGGTIEDMEKNLKAVGDVAGATGSDLGGVMLPFTQALGKGKLDMQDFRQMMEQGAGAIRKYLEIEVAKKGFGSIDEAFEASALTADMMVAAFQEASKEGNFAFDGAKKQALTFKGQLSNLIETIGNVGLELIGVDKATGNIDPSGVFYKMKTAISEATTWLGKNKQMLMDIGKVIIGTVITAWNNLWTILKNLWPTIQVVINMFGNLLRFFATNTAALMAVIAVFVALKAAMMLMGVYSAIQAVISICGGLVVAIKAIWLAMAANPILLLIGLLASLVVSLGLFDSANTAPTTSTDGLAGAVERAKKATDDLKTAELQLIDARLAKVGSDLAVERAQLNYNQAVRDFGPASLEAREASYQLDVAKQQAKDKSDALVATDKILNDQLKDKSAADAAVTNMQRIRDSFNTTTERINAQIDQFGILNSNLQSMNGKNFTYTVTGVKQGADLPTPKYSGGPVSANNPYFVGDNPDGSLNRTSELFIPKTAGTIIGSRDLRSMLVSSAVGPSKNNENNLSTSIYGDINIGSKSDADYFFNRLDRSSDLLGMGLAG